MIANYLSFFKLVGLIYKVEYGSSCLILPENRTMKYILLAKNWSNSELKKLCKITAYDSYGVADDGGDGTNPGGSGTNGGGSGTNGGGSGTNGGGGTGNQGAGGTSQETGGTDSGKTDGGGTGSEGTGDSGHVNLQNKLRQAEDRTPGGEQNVRQASWRICNPP